MNALRRLGARATRVSCQYGAVSNAAARAAPISRCPASYPAFSSTPGAEHEPTDEARSEYYQEQDTFPKGADELTLRTHVITLALSQVRKYGWTDEAIVQGLLSDSKPLSLSGLVQPVDMVQYVMDDCRDRLRKDVLARQPIWKEEDTPIPKRLAEAFRMRLEYVVPYVQSKRWHEAMAMGATQNTAMTASQLQSMIDFIAAAVVQDTADGMTLGHLERAGLGGIYGATELHLLTTPSDNDNLEQTWEFLRTRLEEWDRLRRATAGVTTPLTGDAAVAAAAVVTSMGGAMVSLLQPVAREAVSAMASTVVPHLATVLQSSPVTAHENGTQWTKASDYNSQK